MFAIAQDTPQETDVFGMGSTRPKGVGEESRGYQAPPVTLQFVLISNNHATMNRGATRFRV